MVHLARLLATGADGVPADTAYAVELYRRVVEEGVESGQIRLATDELAELEQSLNKAVVATEAAT